MVRAQEGQVRPGGRGHAFREVFIRRPKGVVELAVGALSSGAAAGQPVGLALVQAGHAKLLAAGTVELVHVLPARKA